MPFDANSAVDVQTNFERPESLPDGDYEVLIEETEFLTESNRKETTAKRRADGYDAKDPSGPMGVATYRVQSGEHQGSVLKDYFWLEYPKDGKIVLSSEQYKRVRAVLMITGIADSTKTIMAAQIKAGLQKAMTQIKGKSMIITTRKDKNDMARVVAYAAPGSKAQTTASEQTEEVPF